MSFKRFDPEDIVLSSELITFPTWFVQGKGDFDEIEGKDLVSSPQQGASLEYFTDFYNIAEYVTSSYDSESQQSASEVVTGFDPTQSKCMFSVAYATKPEEKESGSEYKAPAASEIIYGQYRSLVLGDEDSGFKFGSTQIGVSSDSIPDASKFFAVAVDRARFREKLEPSTCRLVFWTGSASSSLTLTEIIQSGSGECLVLAPDITANERYFDSGRVYDLAEYRVSATEASGSTIYSASFVYPEISGSKTSYGHFLPDIGVILLNADILPFSNWVNTNTAQGGSGDQLKNHIQGFKLRSQETITSNFVFARARNAEFNYSTNPSNITGSAGNLRWGTMINQPQAFITTVGLYNDSNELLAVAKLSKPLVKDFTKEALIRIKLDY